MKSREFSLVVLLVSAALFIALSSSASAAIPLGCWDTGPNPTMNGACILQLGWGSGGSSEDTANDNSLYNKFGGIGSCEVNTYTDEKPTLNYQSYWPGSCNSLSVGTGALYRSSSKLNIASLTNNYAATSYPEVDLMDGYRTISSPLPLTSAYYTYPITDQIDKNKFDVFQSGTFPIFQYGFCGDYVAAIYSKNTITPTDTLIQLGSDPKTCNDESNAANFWSAVTGNAANSLNGLKTITNYYVNNNGYSSTKGPDYFISTLAGRDTPFNLPLKRICQSYTATVPVTSDSGWSAVTSPVQFTRIDSKHYRYDYVSSVESNNRFAVNLTFDEPPSFNPSGYLQKIEVYGIDGSSNFGGAQVVVSCVNPVDADGTNEGYCNKAGGVWKDAVFQTNPANSCCGDDGPSEANTGTFYPATGDGYQCTYSSTDGYKWKSQAELCSGNYVQGFGCCNAQTIGQVVTTSTDQGICIAKGAGTGSTFAWLQASTTGISPDNAKISSNVTSNGTKWFSCGNTPNIQQQPNTQTINTGVACMQNTPCPAGSGTSCDGSNTCVCPYDYIWSGSSCVAANQNTGVSCNYDSDCVGFNGDQPAYCDSYGTHTCTCPTGTSWNDVPGAVCTTVDSSSGISCPSVDQCNSIGASCNSGSGNCDCSVSNPAKTASNGVCVDYHQCNTGFLFNQVTNKCEGSFSGVTSKNVCNINDNTKLGWTLIASQGGTFNADNQLIRYGADTPSAEALLHPNPRAGWTERIMSGTNIGCNDGVFGDPAPWTIKSCQRRTAPPPSYVCLDKWTVYNSNTKYTLNAAYNYVDTIAHPDRKSEITYVCDYQSQQPVPAISKKSQDNKDDGVTCSLAQCYYSSGATKTCLNDKEWMGDYICVDGPGWSQIATEGGTFTVPANTKVRYGAYAPSAYAVQQGYSAGWIEKILSGAKDCSNTVFGDPALYTVKRCEKVDNAVVEGNWKTRTQYIADMFYKKINTPTGKYTIYCDTAKEALNSYLPITKYTNENPAFFNSFCVLTEDGITKAVGVAINTPSGKQPDAFTISKDAIRLNWKDAVSTAPESFFLDTLSNDNLAADGTSCDNVFTDSTKFDTFQPCTGNVDKGKIYYLVNKDLLLLVPEQSGFEPEDNFWDWLRGVWNGVFSSNSQPLMPLVGQQLVYAKNGAKSIQGTYQYDYAGNPQAIMIYQGIDPTALCNPLGTACSSSTIGTDITKITLNNPDEDWKTFTVKVKP